MSNYVYDDMITAVRAGRLPGIVAIYDRDGDEATLTATVPSAKVWRWAHSPNKNERGLMALAIIKVAREHALEHGATLR